MPVMDGYRMAELMRGTQRSWNRALKTRGDNGRAKVTKKYCPIIAITAHRENNVDPVVVRKAMLNQIALKPIGLVEITAILKKYYFK